MNSFVKLNKITTRKDKIYLFLLFIMGVFMSLIETIGISAIMPFITFATSPRIIFENEYSKFIYYFFDFSSSIDFIITFGVLLIFFYLFRAIYSIIYIYYLNKFSFGRFHLFSFRLFKNYINYPYKKFSKRNSSEFIKILVNETSNLSLYIQNILNMVSEIFVIIFLYSFLLFINWKMTLVLTIFMLIKVIILAFSLKNKIKKEGEKRSYMQSKFYKVMSETFGNFKIIKLIQNEEKIFDDFSHASYGYAKANIINHTLANLPRLSLETIGFGVLIVIVIYILFKHENTDIILPIISIYALALYRILPALNRILSSYSQALFYENSLNIIYNELNYNYLNEGKEIIEFNHKIDLKNISFEYNKNKKVLNNINITINKGDKVAFIGESGSGKSTLVDLIIGLYEPISGNIYVDDKELTYENIRSYRSKVGYIPQTIYLFDGTVGENVSFGYEYDERRIIEVLKKASIYDFLLMKEGIDTRVGEGGIQLSGGQKQRIGIARALYSNPEILVLDEATSALDSDTETKIMDLIYEIGTDKTLLIIAHRLSTIRDCNKKIELKNGEVINYENL